MPTKPDSTSQAIRKIILDQAYRAHVGHIGSALSVTDIIAALFSGVLRCPGSIDPDRDRFVLAKGHAMLALHAALFLKGCLSKTELDTYCGDGTHVGVHPEYGLPGVDFATGSLGQGLPMAAGSALAGRMQNSNRRAFALLSDGECNEGSVWEAAMFAAHHKLANLIAIIDLNGQQAFGYTDQVLSMQPMSERWRAFGWDVHEVDGHNTAVLREVMLNLDTTFGRPHAIIARTVFGKGVSFMEGQIKWHYWPMSQTEYAQALSEIYPSP
jgi:transketolase